MLTLQDASTPRLAPGAAALSRHGTSSVPSSVESDEDEVGAVQRSSTPA